MARQSNVTALPPTLGIQDPAMRSWADAFQNAWSKRNGNLAGGQDDGQRFVTLSEIGDLAGRAVADAFSGGVMGGASGGFGASPSAQQIHQSIDNLADSIRKTILYQLLEQQISPAQLETIRQNLEGSINDAFTYIGTESTERVSKDNALASAMNTVWAHIGGSDAVIQDGQLAAIAPNTAQATKWDQVVASVTDPNTGLVNAASIVQELDTYANNANGTFNALYSVRAQVSVGGQTVVGGFGLSATSGAGSAQGPTINFGVRADTFFIAATSATPNAAGQIAQGSAIPFMVLTTSQVVNGVVYGPGVYIKKAVIGDATIGNAQIADATINMAKIVYTIASSNYVGGSSGWAINQGGYAEFNDVIIRRNTLIASGYTALSDTISGQYFVPTEKGGGSWANYPPGTFLRGTTFYIETGFTDFEAIANPYAPGFYGRIESPSLGSVSPGSLSGNVYELAFEVVASPARTWAIVGSGTPGQRVVLTVTPVIRVLQSFTSVTVNNFNWALFRQR